MEGEWREVVGGKEGDRQLGREEVSESQVVFGKEQKGRRDVGAYKKE